MDHSEVRERVTELEGAIKRLDSVRKHLSRNASDIKTEIHASVSRNLECLRGREVSLLGAVDQVLAVKEDTLQGQQARLNQALGVLHTSLSMAGPADSDRQQLAEALDRLNKVELSPEETPYISFRADHLGLRDAILSYGRVDANGLPLPTAFEDPSKPSASLPRHLEEYEDADHHVFYKTLGQSQIGQNPSTSINVAIPKLSTRVEDWLQKKASTPGGDDCFHAARPSSLPHRVRSETAMASSTPGSSCSLNNWLSLIKQHADLEEEHDFEITDNTARPLGAPGASTPVQPFPHVERDDRYWLHSSTEETKSLSNNFFKHIPLDPKVWLAQACSQLKELSASRGKDSNGDLFGHISKESAVWLHPSTALKGARMPTTVKESRVQADGGVRRQIFSHISSKRDDWLHTESKNCKSPERTESACGLVVNNADKSEKEWLMKDETSQPRVPVVELEDMCRANELCCSMSECVSKPDCVTMFYCTEETSAPSPLSFGSSTKDKNQKSVAALNLPHWPSTKLLDWLSPSPKTSCKSLPEEQLEKLSLDMQVAEKEEKKDAEADSCDFFHMIPGLSDPVWHASTNQKGVKEEENLWLQKSPTLSHTDALFKEWLALAKAEGAEDSEGWSIVSDSYSVQSEQQAVDVATADQYINKWLL